MRKVVLAEFVSLDGVAEDPSDFIVDWDDEVDAYGASLIATQDAVVLGRRSYDEWSQYWPGSEIEPFATFINDVAKYVATSTALEPPWRNSTGIDGDVVQFVKELKNLPGGDIGIHASISVAQTLLAAGVIDEVRLTIAPVIVGQGRRLFEGMPGIRLVLLHGVVSPKGYLLVTYDLAR